VVGLIEDRQFLSLGIYGRRHLAHSTLAITHPGQEKEGRRLEEHRKYHIYKGREREGKNGKEGIKEPRGENKKMRRAIMLTQVIGESTSLLYFSGPAGQLSERATGFRVICLELD